VRSRFLVAGGRILDPKLTYLRLEEVKVSAVRVTPDLIRVDVVDAPRAESLAQALREVFEADEVSVGPETDQVSLRTRGDPGRAVVSVLDAVEAWLAEVGLPATRIHVAGRSYRIEARERGDRRCP
jgi:hypothetical protein